MSLVPQKSATLLLEDTEASRMLEIGPNRVAAKRPLISPRCNHYIACMTFLTVDSLGLVSF